MSLLFTVTVVWDGGAPDLRQLRGLNESIDVRAEDVLESGDACVSLHTCVVTCADV